MRFLTAFFIALLLTLTSCDKSVPKPEHEAPDRPGTVDPPNPDDPSEPGEEPSEEDLARESADDTPRYSSPAMTLRHGEPGILMKRFDNSPMAEFHDIDGNSRATFNPADGSLTVNGEQVAISSVREFGSTATRRWFLLTDAEGMRHIVVIAR